MSLQREREELEFLWDAFIDELGGWFEKVLDFHARVDVRRLFIEKPEEFVEVVEGLLGRHGLTVILLSIEEVGRKMGLSLDEFYRLYGEYLSYKE